MYLVSWKDTKFRTHVFLQTVGHSYFVYKQTNLIYLLIYLLTTTKQ